MSSLEVKCTVPVYPSPTFPHGSVAWTVIPYESPAMIGPGDPMIVKCVAGSLPFSVTVLMLEPLALVALQRKTYMSATSGVNVGLRIVVDDNVAMEPAGRRMTVHSHDVAVCGDVSS